VRWARGRGVTRESEGASSPPPGPFRSLGPSPVSTASVFVFIDPPTVAVEQSSDRAPRPRRARFPSFRMLAGAGRATRRPSTAASLSPRSPRPSSRQRRRPRPPRPGPAVSVFPPPPYLVLPPPPRGRWIPSAGPVSPPSPAGLAAGVDTAGDPGPGGRLGVGAGRGGGPGRRRPRRPRGRVGGLDPRLGVDGGRGTDGDGDGGGGGGLGGNPEPRARARGAPWPVRRGRSHGTGRRPGLPCRPCWPPSRRCPPRIRYPPRC